MTVAGADFYSRQALVPIRSMRNCFRPLLAAALTLLTAACWAQDASHDTVAIASFSAAPPGPAPKPWRFATLPNKKPTVFDIAEQDGSHVLRVATDDSYGNLVHAMRAPGGALRLDWRWRLDRPLAQADLRQRSGDDAALKLCVSFDYDIGRLGFGERTRLRLARISTGEAIPGQTLCYVWDRQLPDGTLLDNAFTRRMRFIVLRSGHDPLSRWMHERRDLQADYLRAFGDEAPEHMPDVIGVTVSADADNTHGVSLGYVGDIRLER